MRLVFFLEYDGTAWFGWQTQLNKNTIQDSLEKALLNFTNEKIKVICAGRTDSGVHAKGQVVHFDTNLNRKIESWIAGVNSYLPESIIVNKVLKVDENFHARFSAVSRTYSYKILNKKIRSPLLCRTSTWVYQPLDEEKMQRAATFLVGKHDFSSFRSSECQAMSSIRIIKRCDVIRFDSIITIKIEANAFLQHMVRNIVGSLFEVGRGSKPVEWISFILEAKDRRLGGKTFPPQGLCFEKVDYGDKLNENTN